MVIKEPGERPTKERRIFVQNSDEAVTTAVSIGALVLLAALVILMFLNYDSLKSWTQQTVPQTQTQFPTNTVTPVPMPYPVPGQTTVERERLVPLPAPAPPAPTEPPPSHFGDGNLTTPVTPPADTMTLPSTSTGGN
ncbi:MAG: hypothetical protein K2W95_10940 [Candidatus Obscuribacterales bacterium]|nr:hypothetical protein [Candidatus Obscuribacterales bacterium]